MIDKSRTLNGRKKLNLSKDSKDYKETKYHRKNGYFQFEEDPFSRIAQNVTVIMQEVFLLKKVLQTKSQIKSRIGKSFDL